jgi:hypothetical protein
MEARARCVDDVIASLLSCGSRLEAAARYRFDRIACNVSASTASSSPDASSQRGAPTRTSTTTPSDSRPRSRRSRPSYARCSRPPRRRRRAIGGIGSLPTTCFKVWPALWTFTIIDGVEPANNAAERALRGPAIHRRVSLGTQSKSGEQFAERALSAATTCACTTACHSPTATSSSLHTPARPVPHPRCLNATGTERLRFCRRFGGLGSESDLLPNAGTGDSTPARRLGPVARFGSPRRTTLALTFGVPARGCALITHRRAEARMPYRRPGAERRGSAAHRVWRCQSCRVARLAQQRNRRQARDPCRRSARPPSPPSRSPLATTRQGRQPAARSERGAASAAGVPRAPTR